MPKNKDFAQRIEILDECFRNYRRRWTLQLLIATVNEKLDDRFGKRVSKKSIQNDLRHLKETLNAPIITKRDGTTTYYSYSDRDFSLKNIPIKDEEIERLIDVVAILKQVNDFKILPEVEEIINKLQNTIKTNVPNAPSIIQFERHTNAAGTHYIDDIFTAIKEKVALRITYQSFKSDTSEEYVFYPYLLREYRNRWFLIGKCADREQITNLALDRIKGIKNSREEYVENKLFDPETYYGNMIGVSVTQNAMPETIEIKINKSQAPYIKTKPIHHGQEIVKEFKDGSLKIKLNLIVNYELKSMLLSYGADIEVLKPLHLRTAIAEIFEKGITQYESNVTTKQN